MKEIAAEIEESRKKYKNADELSEKLYMLEQEKAALMEEWEEGRNEFQKLEKAIAASQHSEIAIGGNVYRGTLICFGVMQMPIEHTTCFMKYFPLGG